MRVLLLLTLTLALVSAEPILLEEASGILKSPSYPTPYANNLNQEWTIRVAPKHVVAIKFSTFDLEDSYEEGTGPCVYDYVKITEGDDTVIANLCGSAAKGHYDAPSASTWYRSRGNELTVTFVSDYSNEESYVGFQAHYKQEDIDECVELKKKSLSFIEDWDEVLYCNQHCHNTPGSYYCSCKVGYELHENKHTCVAVANCQDIVLTDDTGVIKTPEFPNEYPKLAGCQWTIRHPIGKTINLEFDTVFDIERHYEEGCVYDWMEISFNGETQRFCGNTAPSDPKLLTTESNEVVVKFVSDLSMELSGFKLTYTTKRATCNDGLQAVENGRISKGEKTNYEFEDVVEFECDIGYQLIGPSSIECLHHGGWSDSEPICRIKSCGVPPQADIPNSHIVDRDTKTWTYLETITVNCNDHYEKIGSGTEEWICRDDQVWYPYGTDVTEQPVCKPVCGYPGPSLGFTQKISGADRTRPGEFPWMTLLTFGRKPRVFGDDLCGASLISPGYVLTAAHCIFSDTNSPKPTSSIHVWLYVHNRIQAKILPHTVKQVSVKSIYKHPLYNSGGFDFNFDVGLVELDETIVMNDKARPICLPSTAQELGLVDQVKTNGWLAGWGMNENKTASTELMKAQFPVMPDHDTCYQESVKKLVEFENHSGIRVIKPTSNFLTNNMFCAGKGGSAVQNACKGDSGGPYMEYMKKKPGKKYRQMMQLGVVSFGITDKACSIIPSYTVYTRINQPILTWIFSIATDL